MKNSAGFTLVELLIATAAMVILLTIALLSYGKYSISARNTARAADVNTLEKSIELYEVRYNSYPKVGNAFNIDYYDRLLWKQGKFSHETASLVGLTGGMPQDPLTGTPYLYSLIPVTGEYQVGALLEDYNGFIEFELIGVQAKENAEVKLRKPDSYIRGDYNKVFIPFRESSNSYVFFAAPTLLSYVGGNTPLSHIISQDLFLEEKQIPHLASSEAGVWDFSMSEYPGVLYTSSKEDFLSEKGKETFRKSLELYYSILPDDIDEYISVARKFVLTTSGG